jgi:hypothetical protein
MSDTMAQLIGEMPQGMLDQTPPAGTSAKPVEPPKIKKQKNLIISTAPDGTVTYYPKKFYKQGLGFSTQEEANKAQNMTLAKASELASGTKSYLEGDALPPETPSPASTEEQPAAPAAAATPTVKPDWVMRREKLGIPYSWDAKLRAWVPANGQRISV